MYNIGDKIKSLFNRKDDNIIKIKTDISGKEQIKKDLDLPLLNNEVDDVDYTKEFNRVIDHIRNDYCGKIYCIRCGIKTKRIVKILMEEYGINAEIMIMHEPLFDNQFDRSSPNYHRTEILFTTEYVRNIHNAFIRIPKTKMCINFNITYNTKIPGGGKSIYSNNIFYKLVKMFNTNYILYL